MAMAIARSSISTSSSWPSAAPSPAFSAPSNIAFHRRPLLVACHGRPQTPPSSDGGGCCGGSSSTSTSSSGSGSCSSHGKAASGLANVGKEFEQMVASATLLEFEKNYISKPMEGTISRDIIEEVMESFPEATDTKTEEKFLDVNALLAEARNMSTGNFIFSDDPEDMVLI